ncbi:copper resistance CopC family protein [Kocuria rosea]|uniref:copper resistance CopC family protein n=1 Tax=Kocuria rosea TaxID=1275 RepID=UPI00203C95BC|nr:copper resistance protein CopC [Kocuria rosea]
MSVRTPRLRTLILAALLGLLAVAGAPAAQAHDALTGTNPADGASISTDPGEVVLSFTQPPTEGVAGANTIEVTAPDGHVVSTGEATVEGRDLRVDAVIDHPGEHTVVWRAVSADGHPIEGQFAFTYTPTGTPTSASSGPVPEATTATEATAVEATMAPAETSTEQGLSTGVLVTAGVLLLALVGVGAYLLGRRTKNTAGG